MPTRTSRGLAVVALAAHLASLLAAAPLAAAAPRDAAAPVDPQPPSAAFSDRVVVRTDEDPENAYALGIGDVVQISVWKNPDLTVEVPVRPDGRISVPLLGDVQAAGMTPLALKQSLTDGYKEYVTAPGVSVVIKQINSQKVFVTGEVTKPGTYDLPPRTKLMQALAMAGGLTPYAKGRVILLRDNRGRDRRYEVALAAIISGKRPEDNMVLRAGDTLIVP